MGLEGAILSWLVMIRLMLKRVLMLKVFLRFLLVSVAPEACFSSLSLEETRRRKERRGFGELHEM
jgi:hypothetical protein